MPATQQALTGTQKAAVVLMNLAPDAAAEVLRQLTETEAEDIAAEIIRLRRVDAATAESALTEFHDLAAAGLIGVRGGRDTATTLLEAAFGAEGAAGLMGRVASNMAGKSFEFLDEVDAGQIVTLIDGELPQTQALILAHLAPIVASRVIGELPDDTRTEVARRIATMTPAMPESVTVVAQSLKSRSGAVLTPHAGASEQVGGVQSVVDIINRADIKIEKAVLTGLEARHPELAEELRSRMLTFADITRFDPRDVQQVLRGTDTSVLAIAMKGASEAVVQTIRVNLSEHNRELLDSELETIGPVRASQVDDAQATVVRAIRELEAAGGITVFRGADEDAFVD